MFETAELDRVVSKEEYEHMVPLLRTNLLRVQNQLERAASFSTVLVIGGVDGAGKGDTVNTLHEWMDPRYLQTEAFGAASDEEAERPAMWRFWRVLPPKGRIGVFFGSWYTRPIIGRVFGQISKGDFDGMLQQINHFERQLADDGTLLLKYWFHLSKKAQKKRLKKLSRDPLLSWRVTPRDWEHFRRYDDFVTVSEHALRETSTGHAAWEIVEGSDRRYREVTVATHLLNQLSEHLGRRAPKPRAAVQPEPATTAFELSSQKPTILDRIDLGEKLSKHEYEQSLAHWQGELNQLSRRAQAARVTTLVVFEGPDAAGKGGAIRRVTRALDARYYRVVPIASPTDEERARHYLWRFWRHLPRAGHMTIFDRSWYGRVLVERVEGFATAEQWGRSYKEINEFEEELTEFGIGLAKFWLHIDQDEQMRRFREREQTPYKEFKITPEDYRNREKWPLYESAVHEMVARTSTEFAPWSLVAANDKRFARVRVLEILCRTLEQCVRRAEKARKKH